MPPPVRRQAPAMNSGFGSAPLNINYSNWRLFKPEYASLIEFIRPPYDKKTKGATVIRPYPCRGYEDTGSDFVPYRCDPGGHNFFGYWLMQLYCADRIGNPATSFLVHNPFSSNSFNVRECPLSVLVSAVVGAIKRGQGRAESWRHATGASFEPTHKMLLEWSSAREGGENAKKMLSAPTQIGLIQGMVPMLGGELQWGQDKNGGNKVPPGWGEKTAVIGLTSSLTGKVVEALNLEVENYRGDPGDFESRYVNGDPVSLSTGRFLVVYPEGGDPRQTRQQGMPVGYDPLTPGRPSGGSTSRAQEKDFAGFDCHFEKSFQTVPASLLKPEQAKFVANKWKYWEDILWFPSKMEQVDILASVLPASMIEYAFVGEHDDWLSEETKGRIAAAKAVTMPTAPSFQPHGHVGNQLPPTQPLPQSCPWGDAPAAEGPLATPQGWNTATSPLGVDSPGAGAPWGDARVDESLPKPATLPDTTAAGGIGDLLAQAAKQAESMFSDASPALGADATTGPGTIPSTTNDSLNAASGTMSAAALAARKRQQASV